MFEINTLYLGELYIPQGGGILRDPVYCWLLRDGKTNILVDSGMPDIEEVERTLKVKGKGGGHRALRAALEKCQLSPEDIDFVIPTHLHFDHGSNLDLFPGACVVIQRDEILHAIDPVPSQRIYYRRDSISEIVKRKIPRHVRYVEGDIDFMEGLRLLKVPAHTPGMQVPVVTTERGSVGLVSDLGDHYRYWFPDDERATKKPMRFLSGTFLVGNIRSEGELDWIRAMEKVMRHADIVIPAHDSRIPKKIPEEWFAIPESTDGDISDTPPEDY